MLDYLHIPKKTDLSFHSAWKWYNNILYELNTLPFTIKEKKYITDYYIEAGLLSKWRKYFFKIHYAKPLFDTMKFLTHSIDSNFKSHKPKMLDLGCGIGTQTLYFAFCGYNIIAADTDEIALNIFKKRIKFYEKISNQKFNIKIYCCNTFDFDYSKHAPIDAVYSLFAFNMMQPSKNLLNKITNSLASNARFAVQDGNNLSWLAKIFPSRKRNVFSPLDFAKELQTHSFKIKQHNGGVSLPPILWFLLPNIILKPIDSFLNKCWLFPVSHIIMAKK